MKVPKYRAWDRLTNKMFPVVIIDCSIQVIYIEESNGLDSCRSSDEVELMQSTGIKGKNGVEVFEGDIVKYNLGRNTFTGVVNYDKDFAGFGVRDADADTIFTFGELWADIDLNSLEVIGNKYENANLLED